MKKLKLRKLIREEIKLLNESSKFNPRGFISFFMDKLKKTGYYSDKKEMKNETKHTISNMKYDMKNGDSLTTAFDKACRDLSIDPDGIEKYI